MAVERRIGIITDEPGWHGARLCEAFAARRYSTQTLSLTQCRFELQGEGSGLRLPGFEDRLPDGIFVRGVPGGSLEEVVTWLDVLHALNELDILVYNDVRAIERSVDKTMTSFLLHRAGLPTPPTWVCSDRDAAQTRINRELAGGHELVVKPVFGSQGIGLQRVTVNDALPDYEPCNGVYYLQRFIDTGHGRWHDWRVFVVRGRAVAAMRREGDSWISNVAHGGRCQPTVGDDALTALAEQAVAAVGMYYAGVDLLRDTDGRLWVTEVNSIPAWQGLQRACNLDVAELLVTDFIHHCEARDRLGVAG